MGTRFRRGLMLAAVAAGLTAAGCFKPVVRVNQKDPPDPLCVSKKPVPGKPYWEATHRAQTAPEPPAVPDTTVSTVQARKNLTPPAPLP